MQVTFTKVDAKRYFITITRERGPVLVPSFGPGYDDLMPHDLAHYLIEEHFEIQLGVWGQLAAGGGGIFRPAPEDDSLRARRSAQRIGLIGRGDMARSEQLVGFCVAEWERSIGRNKHQRRDFIGEVDPEMVQTAIGRLDDQARRWSPLAYGSSLIFDWPVQLTFDAAKSHRGRRPARQAGQRHGSRHS